MERAEAKRKISVLISDLGVLGKMPEGRTDLMSDTFDSSPEFWKLAVEKMPPKGSRDWRWCREYALWGKVPQRKQRAPREPRAPKPPAEVRDGTVRFKKSFIRVLVAAGKDWAADCEGDDAMGGAPDLAESMLAMVGIFKEAPGFVMLKEAAGDWVAEGIQKGAA